MSASSEGNVNVVEVIRRPSEFVQLDVDVVHQLLGVDV